MARTLKVTVTGLDGFIGKTVQDLVKDWDIYRDLRPDVDCIVHLGAPSSHEQFKQDIDGCFSNTINTFLHILQYARDHQIPVVYASSITADQKVTPYGKCKAICEEIANAYSLPTIGLRFACGYGENENHKDYYASVVYKFCKDMKAGIRPIVFGDGTQTRDFVYQSDMVSAIYGAVDGIIRERSNHDFNEILNVGTGIETTFNYLIETINSVLNTSIKPKYVPKPSMYVENTVASTGYHEWVSLEDGVKRVLKSL